jgi:hypothetical protein
VDGTGMVKCKLLRLRFMITLSIIATWDCSIQLISRALMLGNQSAHRIFLLRWCFWSLLVIQMVNDMPAPYCLVPIYAAVQSGFVTTLHQSVVQPAKGFPCGEITAEAPRADEIFDWCKYCPANVNLSL